MNRKFLKNFFLVVLGSLIFAYAINLLLVPNHMGEGGVTGVTLLLKYTLGWDNAITYWIINLVGVIWNGKPSIWLLCRLCVFPSSRRFYLLQALFLKIPWLFLLWRVPWLGLGLVWFS